MCEFSEKLIAWLDQELLAEDATNVARHVDICAECRSQIQLYRRLDKSIDTYCDAALASRAKRRSNLLAWRPAHTAAAFAAAAALLFLLTRPDEYLQSLPSSAPDGAPGIALKTPAIAAPVLEKMPTTAIIVNTPKRTDTRYSQRRPVPPAVSSNLNDIWLPNEAPVYIAIPAEDLFPPGAFPEGVGFVADVNLRPDGSAQRLRLQPQLVGFQTRGTRP